MQKKITLFGLAIFITIVSSATAMANNIVTNDVGSHEQCKTAIAGAMHLVEAEGATCRILDSFTNNWIDIRCQNGKKIVFLKCDGSIFKLDEYRD